MSTASDPVKPDQRWTASNPCPICGGSKDAPPQSGGRCWGYGSSDGKYAICMVVESDREAGASKGWLHPMLDEPKAVSAATTTSISPASDEEAVYRYENESRTALFEVVRLPGKQFRQRRPGAQSWDVAGVRRVLFRLPQLIEAVKRGETVYVVEGEKDVLAVEHAGGVATCNPGGAGKWRDEYALFFAGANVVVVADQDDGRDVGQMHAREVRRSLLPVAASVEIVRAASGKDAADHLDAGHGLDDFVSVAPRFAPMDLASHEVEEADWLVESILLARTYTLVSAKAGAGKTMLALALARNVVEAGGTVVYLDQENGPDVLKERAIALGYTAEHLGRLRYFAYPSAGHNELGELVAEVVAQRPTLVVFDAKANFLAAAQYAEDDAGDNTDWHRIVIQPLMSSGAAVLDLDHTGHNGERARGSSAKAAVAEADWLMSSAGQFDPQNTTTATLKRGLKNRRGVLPVEVALTMGGDGKGGFIFEMTEDSPAKDEEQIARRRRIQRDIMERVTAQADEDQNGLSLNQLTNMVSGAAKEIREVAKDMAAGLQFPVELVAGPRNATILVLKENAR